MKILITNLFFFVFSIYGFTQLEITWQQCYGGSEDDYGYSIFPHQDEYFIGCSTGSDDGDISFTHGMGDYWLIKTNEQGQLIWEKVFGGSNGDQLYNANLATGNNAIYLMGSSASTDGDISYDPYDGASNLWVAKVDLEGDIIWDRKVGNFKGFWYSQYGITTNDGGCVLCAHTDTVGGDVTNYYGGYDAWIIKLDENGQTEWDFTIGSSYFEFFQNIFQCNDSSYLIGANGIPQGDGNILCQATTETKPDAILFKLDANGNEEWQQCYGGSDGDGISSFCETNNGYMIAAYGSSADGDLEGSGYHYGVNHLGHRTTDIWIIKTDIEGNILWQKCYGGTHNENASKIFATSDGGFVVFGKTYSNNGDVSGNPSNEPQWNPSIWIFKIDSEGELLWQQCIGGTGRDNLNLNGVYQKSDQHYIMVVETRSYIPSGDIDCNLAVPPIDDGYNIWACELMDTTLALSLVEKSTLNAYPNPAKLQITFELPTMVTESVFQIKDILGKTIEEFSFIKGQTQFTWDCSNMKNGVYFYQTEIDGQVYNGKIVISQ